MNKLKYILILSLVSIVSFGQERIFDKYDFDSEDYILIGTLGHSDKSGLQDSLSEFYTTNTEILNEFKTEWVFNESSPFYACGYHFFVHICKNGKSIENFAINLYCNMISTSNGYFYFDSEKLRRFAGRLDKPIKKEINFETIEAGRVYLDSILRQKNLIMTLTPDWIKYEGEFEFIYPCGELKKKDFCFENEDEILQNLTIELKNKFPSEIFDLNSSGGSTNELYVTVKSNKTLADQFDLYKLTWKKWKYYKPFLTTWWIKK